MCADRPRRRAARAHPCLDRGTRLAARGRPAARSRRLSAHGRTAADVARAVLALEGSGLFDPSFYREAAGALTPGADPLVHYCNEGWRRGLAPNPLFDVAHYLAENPEVAAAGTDPLLHYHESGEREGRRPSAAFDVARYRSEHGLGPDEACLAHALAHRKSGAASPPADGEAALIVASGLFDAEFYAAQAGLAAAEPAALVAHYGTVGWRAGLDPNRFFATCHYLRFNDDVRAAGVNPLLHYVSDGERENRHVLHGFDAASYRSVHEIPPPRGALATYRAVEDRKEWLLARIRAGERIAPDDPEVAATLAASGLFDENWYLANYPDVRHAGLDPLAHYCRDGDAEGRRPNPYFDPGWYRDAYPSRAPWPGALLGYVLEGERAGHRPIVYFETEWYATQNRLVAAISPLLHYLRYRREQRVSPHRLFDVEAYVARLGTAIGANRDPFSHYLRVGIAQDLDPSDAFDAGAHRRAHMRGKPPPYRAARGADILEKVARERLNPLVHHLLAAFERDAPRAARSPRRRARSPGGP